MHPLSKAALIATATLGAIALPASAQTVTYTTGTQYDVAGLGNHVATGASMAGMQVTYTTTLGQIETLTWGALGNTGNCGVQSSSFRLFYDCMADTYAPSGSYSMYLNFDGRDSNGSNIGNALLSVRLNGAPARTVFDCAWTGSACQQSGGNAATGVGTPGSDKGWSAEPYFAYGNFTYTNAVGIGGASPIGDLYEQLTLDLLGSGFGANGYDTYYFRLDTDHTDPNSPIPSPWTSTPPTTVPEPSTYALMASGLAVIFGIARRRRTA